MKLWLRQMSQQCIHNAMLEAEEWLHFVCAIKTRMPEA